MSLSQALNAAVSGMRTTQTGLALVAGNVANADTPGYVRKTLDQVAVAAGEVGIGVRAAGIDRQLDTYVQRQLQVESTGGSYADLRADFYQRLQQIYGQPGGDNALETIFNNFTSAVQSLTTSPDSNAIRNSVLGAAQVLTQQLNGMTVDIQGLRTDCENGLGNAVDEANQALQRIADINQQLGPLTSQDGTAAVLRDQRDNYINQLAELMDVRVVAGDNNQVTVFTTSGVQLVGLRASQLRFDDRGVLSPQSAWSADPTQRSTGTITLVSPNGGEVDLLASKAIRSGKIAAYLEMRDQVLPQAQAQLDELAAGMASVLSDRTQAGTPVVGPPAGFNLDVGGLKAGNKIELTYTDSATGAQHQVTIVRVDDPTALPLADSATPNPADKVIGVDFSGGMASVVAQLTSALGATGLQFSNPAGTTLRVLNDLATTITVNSLSATATTTSLTSGNPQLPLFVDASHVYSGAIAASGPEERGFAGRIAVNSAILADPSKLVTYSTSPLTPAGDPTRPNFLFAQMSNASLVFSPATGIGGSAAPFNGTLSSFIGQVMSQQGQAADNAKNLQQGQTVVVNALQQRLNAASGVNIDQEMTNLLTLQSTYAANARVFAAIQQMYRDLLSL